APVHRPHEQRGIQVLRRELLRRVALAPRAEALDDLTELLSRRSQPILAPPSTGQRCTDDDARVLQLAQPLAEPRPRNQPHAAADLAESSRPGEELAQDQRRPALGEDLGGDGDRTELAIAF